MMEHICENCKYCHILKELDKKIWKIKNVCTVFPETEPEYGYDAFAIVVHKNETCEMFKERDNNGR